MTDNMTGSKTDGVTVYLDGAEQGAARDTLLSGEGEGGERNTSVQAPGGDSPQPPSAEAPTLTGTGSERGPYEAFALPNGIDASDGKVGAALDEAKGLFRELGLDQQQAQRLVDLHMKHFIGALADDDERFNREVDRRVAEWGEQLKQDPEFGGPRLDGSKLAVRRAIANLGGDALFDALTRETGIINHPEIFKAFARAGRLFAEDKFVAPSAGRGAHDSSPEALAARIYPNMVR